jgi:hypothetical protein
MGILAFLGNPELRWMQERMRDLYHVPEKTKPEIFCSKIKLPEKYRKLK